MGLVGKIVDLKKHIGEMNIRKFEKDKGKVDTIKWICKKMEG